MLVPVAVLGMLTGLTSYFVKFWTVNKIFDVLGPWNGPPALDALLWTFNVNFIQVACPYILYVPVVYQNISKLFLWFLLLLGIIYLPKKKELILSIPFLAPYVYMAHDWIERYLFYLWPFVLLVIIAGLCRGAFLIQTALSKLIVKIRHEMQPVNPDMLFLVAFFLDAQAAVNLYMVFFSFLGTLESVYVYLYLVACWIAAIQIFELRRWCHVNRPRA